MEWNNTIPEWEHEGSEPSDARKEKGFEPLYRIPAGILNWFWCKVTKAIKELQTKFGNHAENKENPHEVTAAQVGLDKVNNTPDSVKAVAFASEAGVGRKVEYALSVRFNGGRTEGTDLWTYDGSTSKSVNITPAKLGAAKEEHDHETSDINGLNAAIDKIATATSTDGTTYTATIAGVTELYNGLRITIIPNMNNTSLSPRLDINGLGDKAIRLAHSFNYAATNALKTNFIQAGRPVELKYDANCELGTQGQGAWIFTDRVKTSAQDLYGTVPIDGGGTGATTAADALTNLGVPAMIEQYLADANFPSDDHKHHTSDITSGILQIARGGTGVTTYKSLSQKLNCLTFKRAMYIGTGTHASSWNEITLMCEPIFAIITPWLSGKANAKNALKFFSFTGGDYYDEDFDVHWDIEGTGSGFKLKWYSSESAAAQFNENGTEYQVLVFGVQS